MLAALGRCPVAGKALSCRHGAEAGPGAGLRPVEGRSEVGR